MFMPQKLPGFIPMCYIYDSNLTNLGHHEKTLVPDYIRNLKTYQAGKPIDEVAREKGLTRISKIASNENPLGPSPLCN